MVAATPLPPASPSTSASPVSGRPVSSEMDRPANVTASARACSPVPRHSGQGSTSTYCSTRRRNVALRVFASVCST